MRRWYPPVAVALSVQITTSAADMAVPVLGPLITAAAGVPAAHVGYYNSAVAIGAVAFYLFGTRVVRRIGAVASLQSGSLICAGALVFVLSGNWWLTILAALMVGIGFGTNTPASAVLLHRAVPADRLHFAFSLKQAGTPIGTMLAGLCLPAIAGLWSWEIAILATSCACIFVPALIQTYRKGQALDLGPRLPTDGVERPARADWRALASLAMHRPMPRIVAAGALLAIAQGSINAFLVTYLVTALDHSLVFAGGLYALLNLVGIPGRVGFGWLADWTGLRETMLAVIGLMTAAMIGMLALLGPGTSTLAIVAAIVGLGAVIGSWNGILLAKVTQAAPADRVGEANSVAAVGLFAGFAIGPVAVAAIVSASGRFSPALIFLMASAALSSVVLPWRRREVDSKRG